MQAWQINRHLRSLDLAFVQAALLAAKQLLIQRIWFGIPRGSQAYSSPGSMPFDLNKACADGPRKAAINAFAASPFWGAEPMPAA